MDRAHIVFASGGLIASAGSRPLFKSANPAAIEIARPGFPDGVDGRRIEGRYQSIQTSGDVTVGTTQISDGKNEFRIEDRWVQASDTAWRVDRTLTVIAANSACGVRLLLDIVPAFAASRYEDLHYFAPSALYDLNDLNRDGVEDYLESRRLSFRDDRLNALTLLAYSDAQAAGVAISRADRPSFDEAPDRQLGQVTFLQATDVGSLGIAPGATVESAMTPAM